MDTGIFIHLDRDRIENSPIAIFWKQDFLFLFICIVIH
jgi:hypothetical protein